MSFMLDLPGRVSSWKKAIPGKEIHGNPWEERKREEERE